MSDLRDGTGPAVHSDLFTGEELTRDQAVAQMDELLALERVA